MIILSTLKKAVITKLQRILTVNGVGAYDPRTAAESVPYGIDSSPIKDMVAVYGFTASDDDQVVLGYINKAALAAQGEIRLFSTDADGAFKFNVWLQANGDCLIGDSKIPAAYVDNFVKWNVLNTALQATILAINTNFATLSVPPVVLDISTAKTLKIKTT